MHTHTQYTCTHARTDTHTLSYLLTYFTQSKTLQATNEIKIFCSKKFLKMQLRMVDFVVKKLTARNVGSIYAEI